MLKALCVFFAFLFVQLTSAFSIALWMNVAHLKTGQNFDVLLSTQAQTWQIVVVQIVWQALLLVFLWTQRWTSEHPLGFFRRGQPRQAFALIACFLGVAFALGIVLQTLDLDDSGTLQHFTRMLHSPWGWLHIVLIGPLTEELVFRDGIQRLLQQAYGKQHKGLPLVGSAACFSLVHLNFAQMLPAFILGLLLALLYQRTRDLRLCLPAHLLNNLFSALQLYYCDAEHWQLPCSDKYVLLIGSSLLGLTLALFYLAYRYSFRGFTQKQNTKN